MRSPGVIYRRYRQIKKKILYDKLNDTRRCLHGNCHYGKVISYQDELGVERTIPLCMYNPQENTIELCDNPQECSAFANKWTKEKVVQIVEEGLSHHEFKKKYYPELMILEWVLDKDLNDAVKNPGFFGTIIVLCIEFLEKILKNK